MFTSFTVFTWWCLFVLSLFLSLDGITGNNFSSFLLICVFLFLFLALHPDIAGTQNTSRLQEMYPCFSPPPHMDPDYGGRENPKGAQSWTHGSPCKGAGLFVRQIAGE